MKTLLIGGNRFVGVEMLWHLLHAGHEVTVLALDSPPAETRPHIRWLQADRNNSDAMERLFSASHFDCVIDNIAYAPAQVETTIAALRGRIGRYLLTSTTDCYPTNLPRSYTEADTVIEDFALEGLSDAERYHRGKRACEAVLQRHGLDWTVLRPCLVTGPRDNRTGAPIGRALHWFEESARSHFWVPRVLDGGPVLLCSGDEAVLKQVWVADLARAVTHVLSRTDTIGQAYNVTGDEVWTNERMVRALAQAAGTTPELVYVPAALLEQAGLDYSPVYGTGANWTLPDNAKLKATGWKPTPAQQWLPLLLEANARPEMRSWYHTRMQEIAMAKHLQRARIQRAELAPLSPTLDPVPARIGSPTASLAGRFGGDAGKKWTSLPGRNRGTLAPKAAFYRSFSDGLISRIGLGTWMGDTGTDTDNRYIEALTHAASQGLNVFDTAINYRHMCAERCVGNAVRRLSVLGVARETLCIASKGGYITHDARDPRAAADYLRQEYVDTGLIDLEEMKRSHSIRPAFIAQQIDQSLRNLGLQTIDLYYLHNVEDELACMDHGDFYTRLQQTFSVLEQAVATGKIGAYGLATWDGLRVASDHAKHLSLERIVALAIEAAQQAGHSQHHLRAVQLPYNVRDHQAATLATQPVGGVVMPAFNALAKLNLYCFCSASVLQGANVPDSFRNDVPGLSAHTAALRAVCETPGVGTALAGMRRITNVEEALSIARM